jgi:hypothetical protein
MTTNNTSESRPSSAKWFLTIDDRRIPAPRQILNVTVIRAQAAIPTDQVIVRDHNSADDEVLRDAGEIDLVGGNVFLRRGGPHRS